MRVHEGAVDQAMVTSGSPLDALAHAEAVLVEMGIAFQKESEFKFRCVRHKKRKAGTGSPQSLLPEPIYGERTDDAQDEVRFFVELTRIDRLEDTYSIDVRRLKGNLRSYKFLYDTLRE
ncbi:hypothetical protein BDV93DRAFT_454067 [Ceratobasidium sp. AG-I]|nr:hypothetical protein BDV93DRAFT_454067 [Ceratobasidium sp. AG-I]